MNDRLLPGMSLLRGQSLDSKNGQYSFAFQAGDGNLVIYNKAGQAIWSWDTANRDTQKVVAQTDGNIVVYDSAMRPLRHTDTNGNPGAWIILQDDGNLVVYAGGTNFRTPLWSSSTYGGHYHPPSKGWLADAVSTAGRSLASISGAIGSGLSSVADLAAHIPLVGPLLHGVLGLAVGAFTFTEAMHSGERIDRALLADLKSKVAAYQEIAPYAATIVSLVPGVGSGVAAGIAASTALMQGMPIDQAVEEGVRNALPGGPAVKAAYSLTLHAVKGDNIADAAGDSLVEAAGLPPQAKNAFNVIYRAAKGENIPKAALAEAYDAMPSPELKHAVQVAIAVGEGKRLQDIAKSEISKLSISDLAPLRDAGESLVVKVPLYQATAQLVARAEPAARSGYALGVGLMAHAGVARDTITSIRSKLSPSEQKGYDMGVSSHIAAVTAPPMPPVNVEPDPKAIAYYMASGPLGYYQDQAQKLQAQQVGYYLNQARSPAVLAGYYMAYGLRGHPDADLKASAMRTMVSDSQARAGASVALAKIHSDTHGIWNWLKRVFGRG